MNVKDRFLKYVPVHTTSDPESETFPSSERQWDLARMLEEEMKDMGLKDVSLSEHAVVTATLPGNLEGAPTLGLIAHMDTSPDFSGENVTPKIHLYEGTPLVLGGETVLSEEDFPDLKKARGKHLITSDGTTLLGADDKAGIAEILTAVEYYLKRPFLPRPTVRIAFTPDEEIGAGVANFDVEAFGADFAFTVDGGELGELEYRNFNAASATVEIHGRNIHPGAAKDKMRNALRAATDLDSTLPTWKRPEHTEGTEGFYHLNAMEGTVERAKMHYILRHHDRKIFEEMKVELKEVLALMERKHKVTIDLLLEDSYYNMEEKIAPYPGLIALAKEAMADAGVVPKDVPIRGGTDGAILSYMGLPCPNLFTGGMNYHGKYEYIPIEDMEKAVEVLIQLIAKGGREKKEDYHG